MLSVDDYAKIRLAHRDGMSIRQIASTFHHSRRKVREVLRLKHALGMSERLIADAVGVGKTAVGEYLRRARVLGLAWPLPDGMDDAELD